MSIGALSNSWNRNFYSGNPKVSAKGAENREQDKFADCIVQNFEQPDNIPEKQNCVGIPGTWSIKQAELISQKAGNRYWEQNFEQIGTRAPEGVKQAWMEAAEAAGVDGMGTSKSGKLTHISQFMVQKVLRQWRGENADDILGSSVQSAMRAAGEALYALEHPLEPHRAVTPEAAKGRENEKKFYQEFLKRLEGLQENPNAAEETENKNVNESKTDTEIITQPDGSKILFIRANIGGMETVTSVELSKPMPFSDKQKDAPADTKGKGTAAVWVQDNQNSQSEA